MSWVTRNLRQTVTYWSSGTKDGYGGKAFGSPITISGRWEDKTELFIDAAGRETASMAQVYVDRDIGLGGYIFLGTSSSTDPTTVDGAREIRQFRKIPTLKADDFERKVML